jgi:hypothetical protein
VELGFLSMGDHLISPGAGLINHQTFKNIPNLFHVTICSRAFWIRGFEGGIGVLKRGGRNMTVLRVERLRSVATEPSR